MKAPSADRVTAASIQVPGDKRIKQPLVPLLLLLTLPVIWGGNYTWMKLALADIGVWSFNAVRYVGAAILVGLVLAATQGAKGAASALLPPPGERLALAAIGLMQIGVLSAAITLALHFIEASRTILVVYTNPIWTMLFAFVLLGERLTLPKMLGLALGLAGLVILTNPLAMSWTERTAIGVALALAGTATWALASVLYKRRTWTATLGQQLFMQLAACMVVSVPLALALEGDAAVNWTPRLIAILAWNMIGPTALAYWIWSRVLSSLSPSTASQFLLLSPVYGVAQSHVVLGEAMSPALLASAACVVAGAALTFWRGR